MIDPVQEKAMIADSKSQDEYGLAKLKFTPDVFYDIGANVGGVTLLASHLFPDAKIISIEPQGDNFARLVANTKDLPNVTAIQAALSSDSEIRRCPTSPGIGNWIFNSQECPTFVEDWPIVDVPGVTLDKLVEEYGGEKYIVKADCESAEMMLTTHPPSCRAVFDAEYLAGEFHLWGRTHDILQVTMKRFMWWLYQFSMTHDVRSELFGGMAMVRATRRPRDADGNTWEDVLKLQDRSESC